MLFRKDPRQRAMLDLAMQSVEKMLKDMQKDGKDLAKLKFKKFQKTHFTSCACPLCLEAKRKKNPHLRGILEDGFKVFVGEGTGEDE